LAGILSSGIAENKLAKFRSVVLNQSAKGEPIKEEIVQ
jgi:hypothetical protein